MTKAKLNRSEAAANTSCSTGSARNLAGTGLTEEDLDSLIEEFDSSGEQMDETDNSELSKKSDPLKVSSISCLNLIEESLQKEKMKKTNSGNGKGRSPKKDVRSNSSHEKALSAKINEQSEEDVEMDSTHSKSNVQIENIYERDLKTRINKINSDSSLKADLTHVVEAMDTSEIGAGPSSVRSEEDWSQSAPSSSSQCSNVKRTKEVEVSPAHTSHDKRNSAPKRKISDYFGAL